MSMQEALVAHLRATAANRAQPLDAQFQEGVVFFVQVSPVLLLAWASKFGALPFKRVLGAILQCGQALVVLHQMLLVSIEGVFKNLAMPCLDVASSQGHHRAAAMRVVSAVRDLNTTSVAMLCQLQ